MALASRRRDAGRESVAPKPRSGQNGSGTRAVVERRVDGMSSSLCSRRLSGPAFALALAAALMAPARAQAPAQPAATTPPALEQAVPVAPAPTAAPADAAPAPENPAAASVASDIRFKLPHDLSPWGMFLSADIVVKAVMIGLALASLLTWTIWLAKSLELMLARRALRRAIAILDRARGWSEVSTALAADREAGALVRAADAEVRLSAGTLNAEGLKERVASRLERLEAAAGRRMIRGTGVLATVGATAPFVGLFGTVWGIMNSFIGISKQHTTNLAVVAPGIAEALLATALGLVAAIPAVVMYNLFSRWNAGYRALQGDAAAAVLRLISRDLDRGTLAGTAGERRRVAAE